MLLVAYTYLREHVPSDLQKTAPDWLYSLPVNFCDQIMWSWGTLQWAICSYYMNCAWLNRKKGQANRATYHKQGHAYELPSSCLIRNSEMLSLVYELSDAALIMEVMNSALCFGCMVINIHIILPSSISKMSSNIMKKVLLLLSPLSLMTPGNITWALRSHDHTTWIKKKEQHLNSTWKLRKNSNKLWDTTWALRSHDHTTWGK